MTQDRITMPDKLIIATPVDGNLETASVKVGYHEAILQLTRMGAVTIPSKISFNDDISRARSRCVRYALARPEWEWMLWWDDDVIPYSLKDPNAGPVSDNYVVDTSIISRMLQRAASDGHEMIGAPYPRKRLNTKFPYMPLEEEQIAGQLQIKNDCIQVQAIAFGFVLTSRRCLERMVDHYAHEWFTDDHDAGGVETVAIFRQVMTPERDVVGPDGNVMRFRKLLSEDYSFCYRWRAMGGDIAMYVGQGSPVGHVGNHMFVGTQRDIGSF